MCQKSQKNLMYIFAKSKICRGAVGDFWKFLGEWCYLRAEVSPIFFHFSC